MRIEYYLDEERQSDSDNLKRVMNQLRDKIIDSGGFNEDVLNDNQYKMLSKRLLKLHSIFLRVKIVY